MPICIAKYQAMLICNLHGVKTTEEINKSFKTGLEFPGISINLQVNIESNSSYYNRTSMFNDIILYWEGEKITRNCFSENSNCLLPDLCNTHTHTLTHVRLNQYSSSNVALVQKAVAILSMDAEVFPNTS